MNIFNYEFKARVSNWETLELRLLEIQPRFIGTDHQIDTYFNAPKGRLKLREGNIENALINYEREDTAEAKASKITLYKHRPEPELKNILSYQLGIKAVVDKIRRIYFVKNVKFHFDSVKGLGSFIEVEAIDQHGSFSIEELKKQCEYYFQFFDLKSKDLVDKSYSDLILNQ